MRRLIGLVAMIAAVSAAGGGVDSGFPRSVTVECGDLSVRFESRSFWTLYRVDYRGRRLGLDRFGSHYGNVFHFPGIGFIGSGHTENENEELLELSLFLDGKAVTNPEPEMRASQVKLVRKSRIRGLVVDSVIEIDGRRITEHTSVEAQKETKLSYAYFSMYPWSTEFTDYAVLDPGGVQGEFTDSRNFLVRSAAKRVALYSRPLGCGVLTEIRSEENVAPRQEDYWDYPDRYRKHYSRVLIGRTLKPGERAEMTLRVTPFEAAADKWKEVAAAI